MLANKVLTMIKEINITSIRASTVFTTTLLDIFCLEIFKMYHEGEPSRVMIQTVVDTLDNLTNNFWKSGDENDDLELEVKFACPDYTRAIIDLFLQDLGHTPYPENTLDLFINKERYSLPLESDLNGPVLAKRTTKTSIKFQQAKQASSLIKTALDSLYNVKVTFVVEASQSITINPSLSNIELKRSKRRKSYYLNTAARVDLTEVVQNGIKHSEIELECISADLELYTKALFQLNHLIQMVDVISDYNQWVTLPEESGTKVNRYYLFAGASPAPRNFKKEDFVFGGLLPRNSPMYSITVKGDGERKNLVVHQTGIWLVRPKRGFPLMEKITPSLACNKCQNKEHNLSCPIRYIGTVLDGEKFDWDQGVKFYPFDCMSFAKSSAVQALDHLPTSPENKHKSRYYFFNLATLMIRANFSETIQTHVKRFFPLGRSYDSLRKALINCQAYSEECGFETDGYIFTPVDFRYKPILSKDLKKYIGPNRTLVHTPDICKLKPWDRLSIDVIVKSSDGRLYVADNTDPSKLILFQGTKRSPFGIDNYEMPPYLDRVIEMEPRQSEDKLVYYLSFVRIRDDKGPNSDLVAQNVWKDINSPILFESLLGVDFKFLRLAMNLVKRDMIDLIPKQSNLLDIGSGNGGDLYKFNDKVERMVSVDPNPDNMNEFNRRVETMKSFKELQIKHITTILGGGEESDRILIATEQTFNDGPIVITSMLSLSFFWSSYDMLLGLSQTIAKVVSKRDVSMFIYYTIEGSRVINLFSELETDEVTLGPVHMKLHQNVLDIDYPNSIVKTQTEYLVVIEDLFGLLVEALPDYELEHDTSYQVNTDYILSLDERRMINLYVPGVIKFKKK